MNYDQYSDLYRLMKSDYWKITPDFQRNEVWNDHARTRFIDSLAKELILYRVCVLHADPKEQKYIVKWFTENVIHYRSFLTEFGFGNFPNLMTKDTSKYGIR